MDRDEPIDLPELKFVYGGICGPPFPYLPIPMSPDYILDDYFVSESIPIENETELSSEVPDEDILRSFDVASIAVKTKESQKHLASGNNYSQRKVEEKRQPKRKVEDDEDDWLESGIFNNFVKLHSKPKSTHQKKISSFFEKGQKR